MSSRAAEFFKDNKYIVLGILCLLAVGVVYIIMQGSGRTVTPTGQLLYSPQQQEEPSPEAPSLTPEPAQPVIVAVHVVGEVHSPGLVWLPYGSRVDEAITLAGGATEYADMVRVNIAAVVHDAMQIIVPAEGEEVDAVFVFDEAQPQTASAAGITSDGLVNINTATQQELQTLPRIGDALSQAIIDFRETHGAFSCIEELINVPRIGAETMNGLRPLVTVG